MRVASSAFALLLLASALSPTAVSQVRCAITEGVGIAGLRIGMTESAALAVVGSPLGRQPNANQVAYSLRPPWSLMVVEYGLVRRVGTRSGQCRTASNVGPGTNIEQVRQTYSSAVSSIAPGASGEVLTYPFLGIAYVARQNQVESVEVFAPERTGRSQYQAPQAQATRKPESSAPSADQSTDPSAYCGTASSIRELVAYQAGDRLEIYLIIADDSGRMISTDGQLTVYVEGIRVRWSIPIRCNDFKFFLRGIQREPVLGYIIQDLRIGDVHVPVTPVGWRAPSGLVRVEASLLHRFRTLQAQTTAFIQ